MEDILYKEICKSPIDVTKVNQLLVFGKPNKWPFSIKKKYEPIKLFEKTNGKTFFQLGAEQNHLQNFIGNLIKYAPTILEREEIPINNHGESNPQIAAKNQMLKKIVDLDLTTEHFKPVLEHLVHNQDIETLMILNKNNYLDFYYANKYFANNTFPNIRDRFLNQSTSTEIKDFCKILATKLFTNHGYALLAQDDNREAIQKLSKLLIIKDSSKNNEIYIGNIKILLNIGDGKHIAKSALCNQFEQYLLRACAPLSLNDPKFQITLENIFPETHSLLSDKSKIELNNLMNLSEETCEKSSDDENQDILPTEVSFIKKLAKIILEEQAEYLEELGQEYTPFHGILYLYFEYSDDFENEMLRPALKEVNIKALSKNEFIQNLVYECEVEDLTLVNNKFGQNAYDFVSLVNDAELTNLILTRGKELGVYNNSSSSIYLNVIKSLSNNEVLKYLITEQKIINVPWDIILRESLKVGNLKAVNYYLESEVNTIIEITDIHKSNDADVPRGTLKYTVLNYGLDRFKDVIKSVPKYNDQPKEEKKITTKMLNIAKCLETFIMSNKVYYAEEQKSVVKKTIETLQFLDKFINSPFPHNKNLSKSKITEELIKILTSVNKNVIDQLKNKLLTVETEESKIMYNALCQIVEGDFPDSRSEASTVKSGFSVMDDTMDVATIGGISENNIE